MDDQKTYFVVMQDNLNALYRRRLAYHTCMPYHFSIIRYRRHLARNYYALIVRQFLVQNKARNPYAPMRMRLRIRKISKYKDKLGGYPYIRIRVRLRMILKDIEIISRKTNDVSANAYMDS